METITKKSIAAFYREYLNNFLTITRMSEYYEMPESDCQYLIDLGRKYHEEGAAWYKKCKEAKEARESI